MNVRRTTGQRQGMTHNGDSQDSSEPVAAYGIVADLFDVGPALVTVLEGAE